MRKCCVAVFFLALLLLTFMTACGGGSAPIAVTIAQPGSTSIPAGSPGVTLTATVAHDSKSGGISWSLTPASGCGALSNTSTTSATYTPPANTITSDCTATITATSVDDSTKTTTLVLTMKAITVSVASSAGSTTTFGSGAAAVTLTATLNNEATGSTDSVTWNLAASGGPSVARRSARQARADVEQLTCGTLVPSTTNPLVAIYTPPTAVPGISCVATITTASKANGNLSTKTYTVNAIQLAITSPTAAVTEYADKGAISLTSTISNDGANAGVTWALAPGCGSLVQSGTSATYTPPVSPSTTCTAAVAVTSVTDPSKTQTAPAITINPNIAITFNPAPPSTMDEGSRMSITVSIANDLSNGGVNWALNPASCGSLSSATVNGVMYTAGPALSANCTAVIKATSATDSLQSASASIAITVTGVVINSPTSPQQVNNSAVVPLTAAISADGSGKGISWAIAPATGCGSLSATSGAAINYTAPAEANLPTACTASITASSTYDTTKTAGPVTITANPIAIGAIASTGITFPATVGQGAAGIPLSAIASYDPNAGADIAWSVSQTGTCGSVGAVSVSPANTSNVTFTPATSVAANCPATITASSTLDGSKKSTAVITVVPLTVSITTPATSPVAVNDGSTQSLAATVLGDLANAGVTWGLNPATGCGSLSANSSASGAAITFTAPTSASTCTATATATSKTDTTKSASVVLNVSPLPISVSLTPPGPFTLPPSLPSGNETQMLNATVNNDINSAGVTWGLTGCGSISGQTTTQATYTAPLSSAVTGTCTATATATSIADTSKSKTASFTVNPLTVSISPSGTQNITEGDTEDFTASVSGDIANAGVTWSLQPAAPASSCGSLSASSSLSGVAVTYTAPSTACSVLIQAFSVSDNLKSASDQINVSATSTVVITTSNLQIAQGMVNMPYSTNVTWNDAVTGGTQPYSFSYTGLPSWATFDQSGDITGTPTAAASSSVTLTVKDSSSPQQSAQATFTLPVLAQTAGANNSKLTGQYACLDHEVRDTPITNSHGQNLYLGAAVFAIAVDGNGNITGGEVDTNNPKKGYQPASANGSITGTYAVGADNRGYLLASNTGSSLHWAIAAGVLDSNGYLSEFRFTEMDDAGTTPSGKHGGGLCYKQYNVDSTAVTSSNNHLSGEMLSGGHVFALNGESGSGQSGSQVGYLNTSTTSASGVMDMVEGSTTTLNMPFTGTITSADSWGRIVLTAGPSGQTANPTVLYITNQLLGQSVLMSANSHNGLNDNDLWVGQGRKQNSTNIADGSPISGPFVMYASGMDSDGATFKAFLAQGTGSSSGGSITMNASYQNSGGTPKLNELQNQTINYVMDASTGRAPITGQTGDVFYMYDTNEAVVLLADVGNGGGSTPQNMLGWLETQVVPTANSGKWIDSDLATSYFMGKMYSPDVTSSSNTGAFTLTSSGSLSPFAQDEGGISWADWGEGLAGNNSGTATGQIASDGTLDPNGTLGVFDINITQGGTTNTQVYCFAASVDKATNSSAKGRLICADATSQSPSVTIVQE